ncbi:18465_t:CDS:10 [Funneliformis geosporum]|uniref:RNA polymerase II-associated protein 3 n=1 Tax=Funneliformis geosporum TaxID=1117311 RepID=A0A9W4X4Z3_9GLOM|nr:4668_t:CDS:10 [Funneliformis geosporum]CAI2187144.1 18465_t:CDS:10 [Funneliformis geosporum]
MALRAAKQTKTSGAYKPYVQSLYKWEKEIKVQEKILSRGESLTTSTYPPIRPIGEILFDAVQKPTQDSVSPEIKERVSKSEAKDINQNKLEKIRAFDYQAWDKFDVDKILKESDEEINYKKTKEHTKTELAAEYKPQQQTKPASIPSNNPTSMSTQRSDRKGKKTARLEQALQEKETGNVFFKKGNHSKAIEHYGKAMELDPKEAVYVINRAMAYLKLQKWEDAELDCTIGLMLHPDNTKALWRRGIARRELGKLEEAKKDLQDALHLEPHNKAVKEELDKLLSAIESANSKKTVVDQTNDVPRRRLTIEEVDSDEDEFTESKTTDAIKTSEKDIKVQIMIASPKIFKPPQSMIEFESDWVRIQQNDEDLYNYIKVIPPSFYPSLLSNFFEADYLSRILVILKDFYLVHDTVNDIYDILYNLSLVVRFDVIVSFLEIEDKKVLVDLFKALFESSKGTQNGVENVQNLIKATQDEILGLAKVYRIQDLDG